MEPTPEVVNIDDKDYSELIERVKSHELLPEDWKWILLILQSFRFVHAALNQKKIAISKLKRMIFGPRTEKGPKPDQDKRRKPGDPPAPDGSPAAPEAEAAQVQGAVDGDPAQTVSCGTVASGSGPNPAEPGSAAGSPSPKPRRPGHGRRSQDSWGKTDCPLHQHESLKPGQRCPKCGQGTLYPYDPPAVIARIVGASPLTMEIHHLQRLRCHLCDTMFTARGPDEIQQYPVATPEACATASVIKYQAATPFNRIATVLKSFGVPLPRTRIWEMVCTTAEALRPVIGAMCEWAARGSLVQNDDTTVKILSLMAELKKAQREGRELKRTGMNTSVIVSEVEGRQIYLFFSGRNHAGENLRNILEKRPDGLPVPIQVCDGAALNTVEGVKSERAGCHDHSRRKFHEIREHYLTSCDWALEQWRLIYRADALAKYFHLRPEKRLLLHQRRSGPVLERMKAWCEAELSEKRVESNCELGKAMRYFLKHYPALTLFLRRQSVPLSNAACERALKIPIGVRKTAYFYKTIEGATVGDIHYSLLATCMAAKENAYAYFVAAQRYVKDVAAHPERWFPWNYRARLLEIAPP